MAKIRACMGISSPHHAGVPGAIKHGPYTLPSMHDPAYIIKIKSMSCMTRQTTPPADTPELAAEFSCQNRPGLCAFNGEIRMMWTYFYESTILS